MTTIAANSSATMETPLHERSVVCLIPVSPLTQYATGNEARTGCVSVLVDMRTWRHSESAAEDCGTMERISAASCSGMSEAASVLSMSELKTPGMAGLVLS